LREIAEIREGKWDDKLGAGTLVQQPYIAQSQDRQPRHQPFMEDVTSTASHTNSSHSVDRSPIKLVGDKACESDASLQSPTPAVLPAPAPASIQASVAPLLPTNIASALPPISNSIIPIQAVSSKQSQSQSRSHELQKSPTLQPQQQQHHHETQQDMSNIIPMDVDVDKETIQLKSRPSTTEIPLIAGNYLQKGLDVSQSISPVITVGVLTFQS
jgi:hypothetical protein